MEAPALLEELLDTFGTIGEIGETYGMATLTDLVYLLGAVGTEQHLLVGDLGVPDSRIVDVIRQLPSGAALLLDHTGTR
ncbi:hypothetical protein [Thiomonas sp.]